MKFVSSRQRLVYVTENKFVVADLSWSWNSVFSIIYLLLDYTYSHHWSLFVYVLVRLCGHACKLVCTCIHDKTARAVQTAHQTSLFCTIILQKFQFVEWAWMDFSWSHLSAVLVFILVSPVVAQHAVSKPARLSLWNASLVFTWIWLPSMCFSAATPPKRKCELMCFSIHYGYVNIRSWFIKTNSPVGALKTIVEEDSTRWCKRAPVKPKTMEGHVKNVAFMFLSRIHFRSITVISSLHTHVMFLSTTGYI